MVRVGVVGEMTVDDVIFEDAGCHWKQIGGGALYAATGALVWGVDVRISAAVGTDHTDEILGQLSERGLDPSTLTRLGKPSLGLWLLYERGGHRHQVQKASGSTFDALDEARERWPDACGQVDVLHVAPQSTEGQIATLEQAAAYRRHDALTVTQDLLVEPFIDVAAYRDGTAIRGTDVFMPSAQEVRQIWGDVSATTLFDELRRVAGIRGLVVKHGREGAHVVSEGRQCRVPVVPTTSVDETGAGDAFSGGVAAGLGATGDLVEAVVAGTVSASIVVETQGAIEALDRIPEIDHVARANDVRKRMETIA